MDQQDSAVPVRFVPKYIRCTLPSCSSVKFSPNGIIDIMVDVGNLI